MSTCYCGHSDEQHPHVSTGDRGPCHAAVIPPADNLHPMYGICDCNGFMEKP